MSSGAAVSLTAALSGVASFVPLEVGPNWPTLNNLGINLSAAAVSTGAVAVQLGAYLDGGDGAGALCTGGPIRSGTITPTSTTGNRAASITAWTPAAGLYWLAFLYLESGTAPTTRGSAIAINGSITGPIASANGIGLTYSKGWQVSGQTALPTTDIRASLAPNTANAFVVAPQAA